MEEQNNKDEMSREHGYERPMSRAEYVQYARMQCERQLRHTPRPRPVEERYMEPVVYPSPIEQVNRQTYTIPKAEQEEVEEASFVELPEEDIKERELEKEKLNIASLQQEPEKVGMITKFAIRGVTAVIVFLFVISLDSLGIKNEYISSSRIKDSIAQNTAIDSLEDSVSTFAKEKVLPIFQGEDTEQAGNAVTSDQEETEEPVK